MSDYFLVGNPIQREPSHGLKGGSFSTMVRWIMTFLGSYADPENFALWRRVALCQGDGRRTSTSPYGLWGASMSLLEQECRYCPEYEDEEVCTCMTGAVLTPDGVRPFEKDEFIPDLLAALAAEVVVKGRLEIAAAELDLLEQILRQGRSPVMVWGWFDAIVRPTLKECADESTLRPWTRLGHLLFHDKESRWPKIPRDLLRSSRHLYEGLSRRLGSSEARE